MSVDKRYEEMSAEEKVKVWAKSWNMLRRLNFSDDHAVELLVSMCPCCVENRETACEKCRKRHEELDRAEESAACLWDLWNKDGQSHNFRFFIRSKKVQAQKKKDRECIFHQCHCPSCGAIIPPRE